MSETENIIELYNASIYQQENRVLSQINFEVKKGEFVYLIGKVGSGKTSLIKTLYAELKLIEGEGRVVDFNLVGLKNKFVPQLRRKIGIVFQDFQLLTDRTVYQNLLFVLKATNWKNKPEMDARVDEVLDKVNLLDKKNKMPHQLSGGEQQRVVIARALLNEPDVILADEPTGNLDPETSSEIMQLLINISRNGKAVVMATHNYSLIKKFPARTLKCFAEKLSLVDNNNLEME
ncbi:MAG: phosphonate ABC transporter ATP-binding protein [Bacteroidetes bacterium GWF2_33_38]|nr:MAG: phosphonate ABC transporter ATP-binding protein [Bacteroidetes bacterium GWF2_33_38]OFY75855.1 MAG: phosphonate ABC transporter ATP-binding protein [Bacteroidetes bacterium RIFOXYA12_FULL_33_9]HBX51636.1 phosphonate ABC transporter ATP-binding protein [Bacteroidales bacterium]